MSYNQPGPYGGQQPPQPGPYGQQPQQPGPYGQQPQAPQPGYGYPQQAPQQGFSQPQQPGPYGQGPGQFPPPPPGGGGGGKKVGLAIAAVVVVAAAAVGGYFAFAGDDDKGGKNGGSSNVAGGGDDGGVKDDGPHKLTTPETVLVDYKKKPGNGGTSGVDLDKAEAAGVKNAKDVTAQYQSGSDDNPMAQKILSFGGVYGEIDDPEGVVDKMFANAEKKQQEGATANGGKVTLVGSPKEYTPSELDGAVLKCQEMKVDIGGGAGTTGSTTGSTGSKAMSASTCIWGDHSTIGYVVGTDVASALSGSSVDLDEAATTSAKLRKEVRVKL
ncbi:hypothetical protein [Streptomyces flavofungini]|uniref:hypothetical protein n=1 Tax=Streptomyces flavofungini TaxID=68200 RepID=UPI0034E04F46